MEEKEKTIKEILKIKEKIGGFADLCSDRKETH